MCGRFVAASDADDLARLFDVDDRQTDELAASYNVAPTMPVYAIAEHATRRHLVSFRWGLIPNWSDDPKGAARMINARAETVADKPAYRTALQRRRCLIPADGFYEWRVDAGGRSAAGGPASRTNPSRRTPFFIHRDNGTPLAFAGLWEAWRQPDGHWLRTCTIVTTKAAPRLQHLHERMPVVLPPGAWDRWLDRDERRPAAALALLAEPASDDLVWHEVGPDVNNVRNDRPDLVGAVGHSDTST
jgi:putative SOS response-associated peptidase YedK